MGALTFAAIVVAALVVLAIAAMGYTLAARYVAQVELSRAAWTSNDALRLQALEGREAELRKRFEGVETKLREAVAMAAGARPRGRL